MTKKIKMHRSPIQRSTPTVQRQPQGEAWRRGKNSTQRGYGYRWQQLRKQVLQEEPLCVFCAADGRITVATVLDHIIPHRGNPALLYDRGNLQPLCAHCHSSRKQKIEKQGG